MRYYTIKKKRYYGEHYGSVRTGFIIGLDKSQEIVNHLYDSYRTNSPLSPPPL